VDGSARINFEEDSEIESLTLMGRIDIWPKINVEVHLSLWAQDIIGDVGPTIGFPHNDTMGGTLTVEPTCDVNLKVPILLERTTLVNKGFFQCQAGVTTINGTIINSGMFNISWDQSGSHLLVGNIDEEDTSNFTNQGTIHSRSFISAIFSIRFQNENSIINYFGELTFTKESSFLGSIKGNAQTSVRLQGPSRDFKLGASFLLNVPTIIMIGNITNFGTIKCDTLEIHGNFVGEGSLATNKLGLMNGIYSLGGIAQYEYEVEEIDIQGGTLTLQVPLNLLKLTIGNATVIMTYSGTSNMSQLLAIHQNSILEMWESSSLTIDQDFEWMGGSISGVKGRISIQQNSASIYLSEAQELGEVLVTQGALSFLPSEYNITIQQLNTTGGITSLEGNTFIWNIEVKGNSQIQWWKNLRAMKFLLDGENACIIGKTPESIFSISLEFQWKGTDCSIVADGNFYSKVIVESTGKVVIDGMGLEQHLKRILFHNWSNNFNYSTIHGITMTESIFYNEDVSQFAATVPFVVGTTSGLPQKREEIYNLYLRTQDPEKSFFVNMGTVRIQFYLKPITFQRYMFFCQQ
jgi:hypothetical protein